MNGTPPIFMLGNKKKQIKPKWRKVMYVIINLFILP